jgi:hypothetical protein
MSHRDPIFAVHVWTVLTVLLVASCSHAPGAPASTSPPAARAAAGTCPPRRSQLGSATADAGDRVYHLTDAVWLEDDSIAVNEDFDFAMGLMGDAMGPAIAAGQRKRANEDKAKQMAAVALAPATQARITELKACRIRAYGLLWGRADAAALRVVIEELGEDETITSRRIVDTVTLPIASESGWATPQVLDRELRAGLERALESGPAATAHADAR